MHERLRFELVEAYEVLTVREKDSQGGPSFLFFCLERLAGVSLEDDARDGVHVATNVQALFLCTRRVHLWGDESIAGALALLLLLIHSFNTPPLFYSFYSFPAPITKHLYLYDGVQYTNFAVKKVGGLHRNKLLVHTYSYVEETGDWVADCESCVFFSGCCKAKKALALIK